MKNIDFKKIVFGFLITYLILFLVTGVPKLLSNFEANKEFAFNFPLLLTIFPIKVLKHYPETIFLILIFLVLVFVLQKKFFILRKLPFIVLMFVAWGFLGLFSMLRQTFDF